MRGVTAGSEMANTPTSASSSGRDSANARQSLVSKLMSSEAAPQTIEAPPDSTRFSRVSTCERSIACEHRSAQQHELEELREVEPGVADHRRDDAATSQIDRTPDGAKRCDRNHRVPTLVVVPESKDCAVGHDADRTAAK